MSIDVSMFESSNMALQRAWFTGDSDNICRVLHHVRYSPTAFSINENASKYDNRLFLTIEIEVTSLATISQSPFSFGSNSLISGLLELTHGRRKPSSATGSFVGELGHLPSDLLKRSGAAAELGCVLYLRCDATAVFILKLADDGLSLAEQAYARRSTDPLPSIRDSLSKM